LVIFMHCDFIELAVPGVRALQPYQPGKPDSDVRREYGLTEVIKLASNENPLGPSPRALAAVRNCLNQLARYPDSNGFELKAALAAHLHVSPDNITLGNGSNDVLEIVARTFLAPERACVFAQYAFAVYPLVTQAIGAEARVAQANPPDHPMPYGHDLDALARSIDEKTRLVFIANPNNPTGTWLSAAELEEFLSRIPEHVLVVVDEAYTEYVETIDYPNTIPWVERFPNLIVTRTFSKAYGLAGLRVGYAVSHPHVANLLNRLRQPFNVNSLAQVAAVAALDDTEHLQRSRQLNREGMALLRGAFDEMGLRYLPSVGNFLCVDMGRPGLEVFQALLRRGVIVRPVGNYDLPSFLRMTIGTERENRRLINALQEVLGH
jgi:histidinol-phosphate aminotransferase